MALQISRPSLLTFSRYYCASLSGSGLERSVVTFANDDGERKGAGPTMPVHNNNRGFIIRRGLATGARGSRGHGWYLNYRAGKGGRHLQGEYVDRRDSLAECQLWNEAILQMGHRRVFLEVVQEPRTTTTASSRSTPTLGERLDNLTGVRHQLQIDLATTIMPETSQNFIDLCCQNQAGYTGTRLYRIEPQVGICGGDVLTNTGKTGQAARGTPMRLRIRQDPLAMWHIPGTVTMLVPSVEEIDSRFMLCTQAAHHLDGIYRAVGQLTPESLATVQSWEKNLLTSQGAPSSYDLIVVASGLVDDAESGGHQEDPAVVQQQTA